MWLYGHLLKVASPKRLYLERDIQMELKLALKVPALV